MNFTAQLVFLSTLLWNELWFIQSYRMLLLMFYFSSTQHVWRCCSLSMEKLHSLCMETSLTAILTTNTNWWSHRRTYTVDQYSIFFQKTFKYFLINYVIVSSLVASIKRNMEKCHRCWKNSILILIWWRIRFVLLLQNTVF